MKLTLAANLSAVTLTSLTLLSQRAGADFVQFSTDYEGDIGGRNVFRVYAEFNQADDILLNFFNNQTTDGSQNGVLQNDFAGGSWNPNFTFLPDQGANDTYVTMNGQYGANSSTALDPSFGSGTLVPIPHNAGWYTSNPGTPIVVGSVAHEVANGMYRCMIMQVGLAYGSTGWTANLVAGYKQNSSATTPSFGYGSYTIPAPGAVALLGIAGLMQRRRRA